MIPSRDATVVASRKDLKELVEHVREHKRFSFDTEFIGESSYHPHLCLIQVATADRVTLLDPFEDIDYKPFWDLVADADIRTIVHAGAQDLEPLVRLHGKPPANIFDTQVAAGFVGLPYPLSLQKLVHALIGVKLAKGHTFTRWDVRPISNRHIRYAADDVRYLVAMADELDKRLKKLGHTSHAAAACAPLTEQGNFVFNPDVQATRVSKTSMLKPRQRNVLRELVAWRDAAARAEDVPPRTMLRDNLLLKLCKITDPGREQLKQIPGLPSPVIKGYGRELAEAIKLGLSAKVEPSTTPKVEETIDDRLFLDRLWLVFAAYLMGRGVDPGLVATRGEMADLYYASRNGRGTDDHRLLNGWRGQVAGELLRKALEGSSFGLELDWSVAGLSSKIKKTKG